MRRTTLGPVSASAVNSYGKAGPGRASVASNMKRMNDRRSSAVPSFGDSAGAGGRMGGRRQSSLVPSAAGGRRQSSIPGHRGASLAYGGRRTDPRPSNDRAYKETCIKNIVGFVVDNGYAIPISPKILTNPTSKDFQHIFIFLVRYLDPSFSFEKRFEDEIPALMKSLGYPFTISKSALSAVGSPHTWPTLLGVLTWILEFIKYDEAKRTREDNPNGEDGQAFGSSNQTKEDALFIENVNAAYSQFLAGADEFPELDQELEQQFEVENVTVREDIARLEQRIAERTETLSAMRAQPSPLATLVEHHDTLDSNIRKFNLLIPSLLEHKSGVQKKLGDKLGEVEALERSIATMTEEIESLESIIVEQEHNNIDVEQIAKERASLKKELGKIRSEREAAEADQSLARDGLAKAASEVADKLRQYHREGERLEIIPTSAKNAAGEDFRISISEDTSESGGGALSLSVTKQVSPAVRKLKESYNKRYATLQDEELDLQEKIDVSEENLMLIRDDASKHEMRYSKLEKEYKLEKEAMADQLKFRSELVVAREEEMSSRRRQCEADLRESERAVENITSQLRSFEDNFANERHRLGTTILRQAGRIKEQTARVQEGTDTVWKHFSEASAKAQEEDTTGHA